jgi:hypothetical protein
VTRVSTAGPAPNFEDAGGNTVNGALEVKNFEG